MQKREAKFQIEFNEFLRKVYKKTGAFELKVTEGPMPFTRVVDHQLNALTTVRHGVLAHKLPDDTRSFRPFDCFSMAGSAFVVIKYRKSLWYAIDIDVFKKEASESVRKSLLESRANEICSFKETVQSY